MVSDAIGWITDALPGDWDDDLRIVIFLGAWVLAGIGYAVKLACQLIRGQEYVE